MDFKQIFLQSCKEFKSNVCSKLKDNNNFRVASQEVVKTVQSYPTHSEIFHTCFKEGELKTLRLVSKIFGSTNIVKFNEHKDLSIVSPLLYVTTVHDDLGRGDIVIPICKLPPISEDAEDQNFHVFVPSDSDDLLGGVSAIPLNTLFPCNPSIFREERLEGFSLSTDKGFNFVSVKANHGLNVGDFLVVRGKFYKISEIHPDDGCSSSLEGSRNMIYVDRNFENTVNRQAFRFKRMVNIYGRLLSIPVSKLNVFRGVSIKFRGNKNGNDHGIMDLTFSRIVFNSSGFYTRNLAISEADM